MHTRCAGRLSVGTDEILTGGEELLKYAMKILHGKDFSDEVLLTILDLVHICSGLFCNKVADPARYLGCAVEFPFMWPELVQVGLSIPYWLQNYQSQLKYPLKQLLTHYVGADYVNRPKTGFTPPLSRWLPQPDFNAKFQEVVGKSYLLRDTLGKTPVEKMVKAALGNPRYFQEHAYNLMWGVFFTEQWFTCARKLHLPVASKQ
jgi:asparagine synthase (glutamine-hydrolysing)